MILAFALTAHRGGGGKSASSAAAGPVVVDGPKANPAAAADCEKVVEKLPVTLQGLKPRSVHGSSPDVDTTYVVAWGDPAVVLSCGVPRPGNLGPGSADFVIDPSLDGKSVEWFPSKTDDDNVFTSIDRSVYLELRVPKRISDQPLPLLSKAIATALPAVCQAVPQPIPSDYDESNARLCVNRPR